MLGVELIINFADRLKLVRIINDPISNPAALVLRRRKTVCNVYGSFTVKRRINAIVDEWRSERNLAAGIAGGRGQCRPISRENRLCRHKTKGVARIRTRFGPLIASKK